MSDHICDDIVKDNLTVNIKKNCINPDGSVGRILLWQEGQTIELTFAQALSWCNYLKDKLDGSDNNRIPTRT